MIEFDDVLREIEVGVDISEGNYDILRYYRDEYKDLLEEVKRLREDYENMSEVLRERGMDICRHCRVIYRDDDMNHPHYPTLHPWHMDGMCMKEMIE